MRKVLTEAVVRAAKAPESGQHDIWDTRHPGFGLRISYGGAKTFVLLYRQNGRKHRLTLGKWPAMTLAEAHKAARKRGGEIADGKDPAAERAQIKAAETFGELADLYLERHAAVHKRPRSILEDRQMLKADLLPAWKDRKLADIRRKDVIDLLDRIVARGALIHANRVRALISSMFNFGVGRDLVEFNPAHLVKRPAPEHSRDRVLSEDELRRLWRALELQPAKVSAAFKLLLLTAGRRSEVLGMRWSEVDLEGGWWVLPAERSKNKLAHRVPLVPSAIALLRSLRNAGSESEVVFRGGRLGQSVSNPQKWILSLRSQAELVDFHVHDLRRTVASKLAAMGVARLEISKLLNHSEGGVTRVYDRHSYDTEKRAALLRWEKRLLAIVGVTAPESNVIELAARAAV